MMQKLTSPAAKRLGGIPEKLLESREPLVLRLLIKAYRKICEEKRYPDIKHEVRFSAVLRGCIDELCLEYSKETGHHWHVMREYPNDSEQIRMGKADPNTAPRIDIIITCWKGLTGRRIKFPFESKLILEKDTGLIRLYIQKGLIDRYLNPEKDYSAGQPWGGMIGYILQGMHNTIVDKLNEQIDTQLNRPAEHLLIDSPIEGFESIYKSRHQRPDGTGILTITHVFFAFMITEESAEEQ